MRPVRLFLLLLVFLISFIGLHYIIPAKQLFPSVGDFIPAEILSYFSDTGNKLLNDSVPDSTKVSPGIIPFSDTTVYDIPPADTTIPDTTLTFSDDALVSFMDTLKYSEGQTRIIYYGDSQIEGDRMTSYLRMSLRKISGGSGPGLFLPVMPVMYTKTTAIRSSPNWKRYNYLSYRNKEISHTKFGPFMTICRYLPEGQTAPTEEKAWVRVKPSVNADSSASVYDNVRIFYRNTEGFVNVVVRANGREVLIDSLRKADRISELSCSLDSASEVEVEFSGKVSPDIYGISIESSNGLIIDNIPQRGSAGLEFTMVDRSNLAESFRLLDPDLVILQYGLNVVKNVRKDYTYYEKGLSLQLGHLKQLLPGVPVILMGLTDMASREGDSIRSYANIPSIIDAQEKATAGNEAIFWNAWNVMGGKASIVRWSEMKPPLAQKDLVHLTYEGADTLSRKMVDSLFLKNITTQTETIQDTALIASNDTVPAIPAEQTGVVAEQSPEYVHEGAIRIIAASLFSYDPERPMIFTTAAFWLFLLVVLAIYSLVYRKLFLRNFFLFLVSLFFYYKSGGLFLFLLIFITVIDFSCGLAMGRSANKPFRKLLVLFSLISNLGILAYFKYTGFIVNTVNELLGTNFIVYDFLASFSNNQLGTTFGIENIILPVGISFFTFQSLSYTIDVYRRKIAPVKNILDFGFFVSFFPQLVAGPIVRASEFIPQLYVKYHLEKREFSHAVFMILNGLLKKMVISDYIAINFVDRVFGAPAMYSGFENLMAVYGYGLQIYCDFSGYTDIAIGVALLFGFRLPVNFNSPYKADGMSDFWKRWHISLSRWLKDYLYIPLGGNRKGRVRTNLNLIITMLLGGLWHGAALRFLIWGFLHGIGLVLSKFISAITAPYLNNEKVRKALSVFLTFNFVSFCWIFFRAPDMDSVRTMLFQMTGSFSPGEWQIVLTAYSSVFTIIAAGYLVHFLPERLKESTRGMFIRIPVAAQLTVVMLIAVLLWQMRATDTLPFIYFRF
jgi:alginate O-acetyltransferase complex protein AlgI